MNVAHTRTRFRRRPRSADVTPNPLLERTVKSRLRLLSPAAQRQRWASWEPLRRQQERPCYPLSMKVGEVLRMLQADGWYLVATRGSHRQFKHASKPGRVTVPGKPSDDLAPGTLNSIQKQAGLKS